MHPSTIVAISTPKGLGAISVIRLSGNETLPIAKKLFPSLSATVEPWKMYHAHAVDPTTKSIFEEVLLCFMLSPNSYTGEDVLEIYCHGGWLAPQIMLKHLIDLGAIQAKPGEFTRRALDNGKIDLVQAEYVHQLINANSQKELELSVKNIQGHLSKEIESFSHEIHDYMVWAEAVLSYPEHIEEERDLEPLLKNWLEKIQWLIDQHHKTKTFEDGYHVVIAGKTNVGKSSLFNLLSDQDRSLVSPYASTTHDYIAEQIIWDGQSFYLYDTAGWTINPDPIDQLCMDQTKKIVEKSSILLLVADLSDKNSMDENYILNLLNAYPKKTWLILNKSDLNESIPKWLTDVLPSDTPMFVISTHSTNGIDELKSSIAKHLKNMPVEDWQYHINERWYNILCVVRDKLFEIEKIDDMNHFIDMIMSELKQIHLLLNDHLGYNLNQDLHDEIFHQFCIGK